MSTALTIPPELTLEEFLAWDAPGPCRWQLIDGAPVAMAPAGITHGIIQVRIAHLIDGHLAARSSPCVVVANPGVIPAFRADRNFFIPDAAVTRAESDIGASGMREPLLVIEILSPSNQAETWRNIRAYMLIPSVREILMIHADRAAVELLRRHDDGSWPDNFTMTTEGQFTLASVDLSVPLAELYRRSGVG